MKKTKIYNSFTLVPMLGIVHHSFLKRKKESEEI